MLGTPGVCAVWQLLLAMANPLSYSGPPERPASIFVAHRCEKGLEICARSADIPALAGEFIGVYCKLFDCTAWD